MKTEQTRWLGQHGWSPDRPGRLGADADIVLLFGSGKILSDPARLDEVSASYPRAHLLGCSTAGEICGTEVTDDSLVCTAISFEHTRVAVAQVSARDTGGSFEAGASLARSLDPRSLVHAFVLSDGLSVNGSQLVAGLSSQLPADVTVTGGLSADGARFEETFVLCDGVPTRDAVTLLGLYGDRLRVGYASLGGWDPFGPERVITRSEGNVLYELDGQSALGLYKRYLGDLAAGLPATGLRFPLSVRTQEGDAGVVRTVLSIDERDQSMTFAGDLPHGAYARLMKANFDRLIDGAAGAARTSAEAVHGSTPDLAILISCVGRKMVLGQRIEEEVESVREIMGEATVLAGFYSYGEVSPFTPNARCELHNQTMTITTLAER
jgi:hypothetical protein